MAIRVLDEKTINMIAAGEVIENPSNVVKELVENAIDAKAKNIIVEISGGGIDLIKVVDDGEGFDKDEIDLAFLEHATSKLSKLDDIYDIDSYGFRGEALPSIASVSEVSLITKKQNSKGYKYSISFGKASMIEESASNDGSTIIIKDLFKNTPARRKFLKSEQKESANVYDIVLNLAYVNSDIAFTFIVDGRVKFKTSGKSDAKSIIYEIYGKEIYDSLIKVENEVSGIKINGYIAKPIVARNNKSDIIYFVNKRFVKSKIIEKAITDAYSTYLMMHKYPLAVLFIDIDKKTIDINVHPKKEEVRFASDDIVYYAVYNTAYNALNQINLIHEEKLTVENKDNEAFTIGSDKIEIPSFEEKGKDIDSLESLSGISFKGLFEKLDNVKNEVMKEKPFIQKTLSEDHRYIGQVFATYILVEFNDKLYIIDQHAAHEKINFETFMKRYKNGDVMSQKIFPSIVIKLTPIQMEALTSNIDEFRKAGYEIEQFGDNDIKIDSIPYNLPSINNKELLLDMIDTFTYPFKKDEYESVVERIASISCKKAIKANHVLSEIEVKTLLRELFKLDNPYNCPHGRPTIISLSKYEFEKRFGRIV